MEKYKSDIVLGEQYEDTDTGFKGTAAAIHFYKHACERVTLKGLDGDGKIVEFAFDAPELRHVESRQVATSSRPGGPRDRTPAPRR